MESDILVAKPHPGNADSTGTGQHAVSVSSNGWLRAVFWFGMATHLIGCSPPSEGGILAQGVIQTDTSSGTDAISDSAVPTDTEPEDGASAGDAAEDTGLLADGSVAPGSCLAMRRLQYSQPNNFNSFAMAPNGGMLAVGLAVDNLDHERLWIARLDAEGAIQWSKNLKYGPDEEYTYDRGFDAAATPDGWVVVGWTATKLYQPTKSNSDPWVIRLDEKGEVLWEFVSDRGAQEWAHKVVAHSDGTIFVGGVSRWDLLGRTPWVLRLDASGALLWTVDVPRIGFASLSSMTVSEDGSVWVGTREGQGEERAWLSRISPDGQLIADEMVSDAPGPNVVGTIIELSDQSVLFTIDTEGSQEDSYQSRLLRVNAAGTTLWSQALASESAEELPEPLNWSTEAWSIWDPVVSTDSPPLRHPTHLVLEPEGTVVVVRPTFWNARWRIERWTVEGERLNERTQSFTGFLGSRTRKLLGATDGRLISAERGREMSHIVPFPDESCNQDLLCLPFPEGASCPEPPPCQESYCDASIGCATRSLPDNLSCADASVCVKGECRLSCSMGCTPGDVTCYNSTGSGGFSLANICVAKPNGCVELVGGPCEEEEDCMLDAGTGLPECVPLDETP